MQPDSTIYYRDRWLIFIGVPLVNFLNYYLTYSVIRFDWFFALTFSIDTATGYLSWYALRSVITWLDKKYSWERGIVNRLVVQIPLSCIAFLGVIILTTEIVNLIARDKPVPLSFYTFDVFIFFIWGLFLNIIYVSLYLVGRLENQSEKKNMSPLIWVKIGKQQKPVNLEQSLCFFVEHECVYGVGRTEKQIINGYTLDKLEKLSDPSRFFRANRQFLITRDIIKSIKREENGKLSVALDQAHPGLPESIMVSRLRASALRDWVGS